MRYVGVDIESTGNQPGYKVVQIGVAFGTHDVFESFVRPEVDGILCSLEPGVEELTGITPAMLAAAPSAAEVDERLYGWLLQHGVDPSQRHGLIPVGWNVGGFDMPAIRRDLPRSASVFSYRSADLNSLVFARVDTDNQYEAVKKAAKRYAERIMGVWKEHTAGGDAVASLLAFEYLRRPTAPA